MAGYTDRGGQRERERPAVERRRRDRGRGAPGPARRRHRQGDVGPRPDRRGRPLLREALHALAAPALVDRGLRLHRGRPPVGRSGHVHRGGAQVPRPSASRSSSSPRTGSPSSCFRSRSPRRTRRRSSSSPRRSPTRPSTSSSGTASTARSSTPTPTASPSSSTSTATSSTRTGRRCSTSILHECAEDLRKDPSDFPALVRGVTVYMVVIEGMLALTAARFMIKSLKEQRLVPRLRPGLHRGQPRRVAPRRLRGEVPRRRDQGRPGEREDRRGDAEGEPAGRAARVRAAVGRRSRTTSRRPSTTRPRSSSTRRSRCRRSSRRWASTRRCSASRAPRERSRRRRGRQARRPGPALDGRPRADPRGRLEILKAEGYAGLDDRQGRRPRGREQGAGLLPLRLQAGPDRRGGPRARRRRSPRTSSTALEGATTVEEIVAALGRRRLGACSSATSGSPRVYFDLNAVSVVEDEVREVMREVKARWREVLAGLLGDAGVPARDAEHVGAAGDRRRSRGSASSGSSAARRRSCTERATCSSGRPGVASAPHHSKTR